MPRYPEHSPHAEAVPISTFSAFAARLQAAQGDPDFVPLHLGDTYPLPPLAARSVNLSEPGLHRYGPVAGTEELREAGAADLAGLGLAWARSERTFVTPGATGGLDVALDATLAPGDRVLILTPTWPLIFGLVARRGAEPVQVPVSEDGRLPSPADLRARLLEHLDERTVGLAFVNPNNPSGFAYTPAHLEVFAELAGAHSLWVYCDAVYADLVYDPARRVLAELPDALEERTFVVSSYSKSFGLAGQRVGLLHAPSASGALPARLLTHTCYHAGNLAQAMVLASLRDDPGAARQERVELARSGSDQALSALEGRVPVAAPDGGAFLLLDLRERCAGPDDVTRLLERSLERGFSLAPGSPFGADFGRFARLCFTAVRPGRLALGLERLVTLLDEG